MTTQYKIVHVNPETGEVIKQGYTGGAGHVTDGALATKITSSGGYTYIGEAVPPSTAYASRALHEAALVWRVHRLDAAGNVIWADGDGNFDNAATDLTSLSYTV